jgi:hypothetical protein
MTAPKQGRLLLTDEERRRLFDQNLNTAVRKRNTLIVKRKMQNWFSQTEDVIFALEHLTETQIEQTISDDDVFALFKLSEIILDKLHFSPVRGDPGNPFVSFFARIPNEKFPQTITRRAKESDFEKNWETQQHLLELQKHCPSPNFPDLESPAYRDYRQKREAKPNRLSITEARARAIEILGKDDSIKKEGSDDRNSE